MNVEGGLDIECVDQKNIGSCMKVEGRQILSV
jgi:hypothetical protein